MYILKKFAILLLLITISSCSNKNNISSGDQTISNDFANLILDTNIQTSITSVETITFPAVSVSAPTSSTTTITVKNLSGTTIAFNFADLDSKLLLNKRFVIPDATNTCKTLGKLKTANTCNIQVYETYQPTEDYSVDLTSKIIGTASGADYGKITLKGSITIPPASRLVNTIFSITPPTSQSFSLSDKKLTQTNTFTVTNISGQTVAVTVAVPSLVLPANGGVISRNGCIDATSAPLKLKYNSTCSFDITYTYDSNAAKASYIDQLTLSTPDTTINTSTYSLPITINNAAPSTPPANALTLVQSQIIGDLSNATAETKLTVLNTSSVSVDPKQLTIQLPFIKSTSVSTCDAVTLLKPSLSCYYLFKLDTTKTVNMTSVERKIKVATTDGFLYAGSITPTIAEDKISCKTGYAPDATNTSCILSNPVVTKNITINKKIGSNITNLATLTAASDVSLNIFNTILTTSIKTDPCLKNSATCTSTFLSTDIVNNVNLYLKFMADVSAISPGYQFKSLVSNGQPVSTPIGSGNQLEIKTLTINDYIIDVTYEPICTVKATQVATVLDAAVVQSANIVDYKTNIAGDKCIIKSCATGFSPDSNGLNCVANPIPNGTLTINTKVDGVLSVLPFGDNYKGDVLPTSYRVSPRGSAANGFSSLTTTGYPSSYLDCAKTNATCTEVIEYNQGVKSMNISNNYTGLTATSFKNEYKLIGFTVTGLNSANQPITCNSGVSPLSSVSECMLSDLKGDITVEYNYSKGTQNVSVAKKRAVNSTTTQQYSTTEITPVQLGLNNLVDDSNSSIYNLKLKDSLDVVQVASGGTTLGVAALGSGSAETYNNYITKIGSNIKVSSTISTNAVIEHVGWEVKSYSNVYNGVTQYDNKISIVSQTATDIVINTTNVFDDVMVMELVRPKPIANFNLTIKKIPLVPTDLSQKADVNYLISKPVLADISGTVLKTESQKVISVANGSSIKISKDLVDAGYRIKSIYSELPSMSCVTVLDSCTISNISKDETVIVEIEPIDIILNLAVNIAGISTEAAANISDLTKVHVDSIANLTSVLNSNKVITSCVDGSGSMANGNCALNTDIYAFDKWTFSTGIIGATDPTTAAGSIGFDGSQVVVTATANYKLKNTLYNDLVSKSKYEIYPFGTQGSQFDLDSQWYFPVKKEQNPNGSIASYNITSIKKGASTVEYLSNATVFCLDSSNIPTAYWGSTSLTSYNGTALSGVTHTATMSATADLKSCAQIALLFPEIADDTFRSDTFTMVSKMTSTLLDSTGSPFVKTLSLTININPNNDMLPSVTYKDAVSNTQIINNHYATRPFSSRTLNGITYKTFYGGSNSGVVSGVEYGNRPEFFYMPYIADNTNVKVDMNVSSLEAAHSSKSYVGSLRVMDARNNCRYVNNQPMTLGAASSYSTTYTVRTALTDVVKDAGACATIDSLGVLMPDRYDFIGNDDFNTCDANEFCFDNTTTRTFNLRAKVLSSDNEATFVNQVIRVEKELPGANPTLSVATTVKDSTGSMVPDTGNKVKVNDAVNFTAINSDGTSSILNCGTANADCKFKIAVFKETENNLTYLDLDMFNKNIIFETALSTATTHSYTPVTTGVYNIVMVAYNTVTKRTARALSTISVQNNYHDAGGMAALSYLVETLPNSGGYKIYLDNDFSDPLAYSNADVGFWGYSLSKLTLTDKTTAIRYFNDQYAPEVVLVGSKVAIIKLPNVAASEYDALVKMHYKNPSSTSANDDSPFYQFIKIHKCTDPAKPFYSPYTQACDVSPCSAGTTLSVSVTESLTGQVSEVLSRGYGGLECL